MASNEPTDAELRAAATFDTVLDGPFVGEPITMYEWDPDRDPVVQVSRQLGEARRGDELPFKVHLGADGEPLTVYAQDDAVRDVDEDGESVVRVRLGTQPPV